MHCTSASNTEIHKIKVRKGALFEGQPSLLVAKPVIGGSPVRWSLSNNGQNFPLCNVQMPMVGVDVLISCMILVVCIIIYMSCVCVCAVIVYKSFNILFVD